MALMNREGLVSLAQVSLWAAVMTVIGPDAVSG